MKQLKECREKKKPTVDRDELLRTRVYLSERECDVLGLMSRKQRERLRESKQFPDRVKLSYGRWAYPITSILDWIADPEGWGHRASVRSPRQNS